MKKLKLIFYLLIIVFCSSNFLSAQELVPTDFKVIESITFEKFKLRKLTVKDAVKDYNAIMSSIEHLKGNTFGPKSNWLKKELTLKQDSIDLKWHQDEFDSRSSFAYAVTDLTDSKIIGCVYIFKPKYQEYDATLYMWVTKEEFDKGLDEILYREIKNWIKKKWPFKNPAYPGREIVWKEWYAKDKSKE